MVVVVVVVVVIVVVVRALVDTVELGTTLPSSSPPSSPPVGPQSINPGTVVVLLSWDLSKPSHFTCLLDLIKKAPVSEFLSPAEEARESNSLVDECFDWHSVQGGPLCMGPLCF